MSGWAPKPKPNTVKRVINRRAHTTWTYPGIQRIVTKATSQLLQNNMQKRTLKKPVTTVFKTRFTRGGTKKLSLAPARAKSKTFTPPKSDPLPPSQLKRKLFSLNFSMFLVWTRMSPTHVRASKAQLGFVFLSMSTSSMVHCGCCYVLEVVDFAMPYN